LNHRKLVLSAVLLATLVGNVAATRSQDDASMQAFWEKFKTAVTKHDKATIAGMTQFPLQMPYRVPAVRTRAQLFKRYQEVFKEQEDAVKCFATAKPEKDSSQPKTFTVACGEFTVYGFAWTKSGWKFKYLDNVAE